MPSVPRPAYVQVEADKVLDLVHIYVSCGLSVFSLIPRCFDLEQLLAETEK
jgi:hypothetical protein